MIKCVLKLVTSHELGLNICNVMCTHQKHTFTEVIVATRGLSFVIVPSNKDALSHHFYVCLVCSYVGMCVFVCVHTCVCVFICVYMSSSVPTIPSFPHLTGWLYVGQSTLQCLRWEEHVMSFGASQCYPGDLSNIAIIDILHFNHIRTGDIQHFSPVPVAVLWIYSTAGLGRRGEQAALHATHEAGEEVTWNCTCPICTHSIVDFLPSLPE